MDFCLASIKTPHSLAGLPGHINKGCIENMSSAYVNNHFNHVQPFNVYMILCDPNPFIQPSLTGSCHMPPDPDPNPR